MSKSSIQYPLEYKRSPVLWKPRNYQVKAVKWLVSHRCAGLFLSPSLGKTSIVLAMLKVLRKRDHVGRMLVIAPMRVASQVWPAEGEKWTDFNGFKIEVAHGKNREEVLAGDADIVCMNPEGLGWLLDVEKTTITTRAGTSKKKITIPPKRLRFLKSLGFDILVVDESTRFKNSNALCSKLLKKIIPFFQRRYILTGTPTANSLMDIYGQMYILDEGRTLGRYITQFRNEFFMPDGFAGFSYKPLPGAMEAINERIAPYILRMNSEDYLELPELIENVVPVYLPPAARKVYNTMEKKLVVQINERTFTAASAGVAAGKCAQIANGALYYNDDEDSVLLPAKKRKARSKDDYEVIHNEKDEALISLVEELSGSPLLVAYEFQHDYDRIVRAMKGIGVQTERLGSGQSSTQSKAIERAWNAGQIQVLLGHPRSIGHGLNLQDSGNNLCWYSPTYDNEWYVQLNARLRRQGSVHSSIFVHLLVCQDTVDEAKVMSVRRKESGQQALFKALSEYLKKRKY